MLTWNIYRLTADLLHLLSFFLLIFKIRRSKNCIGLSCKTQILLLIVFCTRYSDIFTYFDIHLEHPYLLVMKILFISATAYTIFLMRFQKPYCESYDDLGDNFKHWLFLIPGACIAAIRIHRDWTFTDYIWSISIWLEAVAILPQLHMVGQLQEIENLTAHYVGTLGLYRFFYIFNWAYKYYTEGYICWTSVCGGVFQTALFADFMYYYVKYYIKNYRASHFTYAPTPQGDIEIGKIESNLENDTTIDPASQYQNLEGEVESETATGPVLQQQSI